MRAETWEKARRQGRQREETAAKKAVKKELEALLEEDWRAWKRAKRQVNASLRPARAIRDAAFKKMVARHGLPKARWIAWIID